MKPTAGEIWFDGARDRVIGRSVDAHIPEGRGIFPGLSVAENLQMAAMAGDGPAQLERAYGLFPVLGQRRAQQAGTLSGGEQQMLSLARAIVTKPRLLMVDELSLGLAPRIVAQLFATLQDIRSEGTSILLVEQYVRYALRLADFVVIMQKGRIAFIGESGELQHDGRLVEAYLGGTQAATVDQNGSNAAATSDARPT